MSKINEVYDFLISKYDVNEPIFLSEISIPGMEAAVMRQQQ